MYSNCSEYAGNINTKVNTFLKENSVLAKIITDTNNMRAEHDGRTRSKLSNSFKPRPRQSTKRQLIGLRVCNLVRHAACHVGYFRKLSDVWSYKVRARCCSG